MENMVGIAVNIIFVFLALIILFGIVVRLLKDNILSEKSLSAEVIDKQTFSKQSFFKSQIVQINQKYVLVFVSENKKLSFYVSESTYNRIKLRQKGILKHRGSKFTDFISHPKNNN